MLIVKLSYKIVFFNWAFLSSVKKEMKDWLSEPDMKVLLSEFKKKRKLEKDSRPKSQSFGHWYNMKLAYSTLVLYNSLKTVVSDDETIYRYVKNITWNMSKDIGAPLLKTMSVFSKPQKRIQRINNLLWSIVWTKPFKRENVRMEENVYSFEVVRCPYSDFFTEKKETRLCSETICSLDYKLAKEWGAKFDRKDTIVSGCDKCDFKFTVPESSENATSCKKTLKTGIVLLPALLFHEDHGPSNTFSFIKPVENVRIASVYPKPIFIRGANRTVNVKSKDHFIVSSTKITYSNEATVKTSTINSLPTNKVMLKIPSEIEPLQPIDDSFEVTTIPIHSDTTINSMFTPNSSVQRRSLIMIHLRKRTKKTKHFPLSRIRKKKYKKVTGLTFFRTHFGRK